MCRDVSTLGEKVLIVVGEDQVEFVGEIGVTRQLGVGIDDLERGLAGYDDLRRTAQSAELTRWLEGRGARGALDPAKGCT